MKTCFALAAVLAIISASSAQAAIPSGEATALASPAEEPPSTRTRFCRPTGPSSSRNSPASTGSPTGDSVRPAAGARDPGSG